MHIHEVIKGFGHLRELDLLREVSSALDEIDELSSEDDLSLELTLGLAVLDEQLHRAGIAPPADR